MAIGIEKPIQPAIAQVGSEPIRHSALSGLSQRHRAPSILGSGGVKDNDLKVAPLNLKQRSAAPLLSHAPDRHIAHANETGLITIMPPWAERLNSRGLDQGVEQHTQQQLEKDIEALLTSNITPSVELLSHETSSEPLLAPPLPRRNPLRTSGSPESSGHSPTPLKPPQLPLRSPLRTRSPSESFERRQMPNPGLERASDSQSPSQPKASVQANRVSRAINKLAPPVTRKLHKEQRLPKPDQDKGGASTLFGRLSQQALHKPKEGLPPAKPTGDETKVAAFLNKLTSSLASKLKKGRPSEGTSSNSDIPTRHLRDSERLTLRYPSTRTSTWSADTVDSLKTRTYKQMSSFSAKAVSPFHKLKTAVQNAESPIHSQEPSTQNKEHS